MGLRKDVKNISSKVEEIKEKMLLIEKNLMPSTIARAHKYSEIKEDLKNIELKVSNIVPIIDDHGNKGLKIYYEMDPIIISLDDEGNLPYVASFAAINKLDLISGEDMQMISKRLGEILNDRS